MTERRKQLARATLNVNVGRGKITRMPCEECGSRENVEAHHDDYQKPLQVRWLCRDHHAAHHVAKRGRSGLCTRCGDQAKKGQAFCRVHHAAYMREWRKDNPISDQQRRRNIARVTVNVYVKRGKIQKTPCPCCGSAEVKARILDYSDPLNTVQWLCADSHAYAVRTGVLPRQLKKAA